MMNKIKEFFENIHNRIVKDVNFYDVKGGDFHILALIRFLFLHMDEYDFKKRCERDTRENWSRAKEDMHQRLYKSQFDKWHFDRRIADYVVGSLAKIKFGIYLMMTWLDAVPAVEEAAMNRSEKFGKYAGYEQTPFVLNRLEDMLTAWFSFVGPNAEGYWLKNKNFTPRERDVEGMVHVGGDVLAGIAWIESTWDMFEEANESLEKVIEPYLKERKGRPLSEINRDIEYATNALDMWKAKEEADDLGGYEEGRWRSYLPDIERFTEEYEETARLLPELRQIEAEY